MDNLFDTIVRRLPKATAQQKEQLKQLETPTAPQAVVTAQSIPMQKMPFKTVVSQWQKNQTPQLTSLVLKKLQPTIKSALTSYASGQENSLKIKAASIALNTLKSYDPAFGTDPATHVFHGLKRLNRLSADRSNILKYPQGAQADTKKLLQMSANFQQQEGRQPTLEELANMTGFNTRKVDRLLNSNKVYSDSSMRTEESRESTFQTKDLTDQDYFEYVYASVGPTDQKIMEWTSGLHGKRVLPNNEIAAKLKISPAAVSQRKQKIQSMMSQVRGLL